MCIRDGLVFGAYVLSRLKLCLSVYHCGASWRPHLPPDHGINFSPPTPAAPRPSAAGRSFRVYATAAAAVVAAAAAANSDRLVGFRCRRHHHRRLAPGQYRPDLSRGKCARPCLLVPRRQTLSRPVVGGAGFRFGERLRPKA